MRALVSETCGGPTSLVLAERPTPEPGIGQLRVRVHACGINYPDVLIIEDKYQYRPDRPFSPGCEVSGIVDAIGEGCTGWKVGDPVAATMTHGGLAEQALVAAAAACPLPPDVDLVAAAGLLLTYGTAYHALVDRGGLRAGETVLVLGAAGGVGIATIEVAKALGATVVAAVSTDEKATAARAAGADDVLVYPTDLSGPGAARAMADAFKRAVGSAGADVVVDPVGGEYAEPALRAIAWEGRFLVIGFPAGIPRLPLNLILLKSCDVRGVFFGEFINRDPATNRHNLGQLIALWQEGRIRPLVDDSWTLETAAQALVKLADRSAVGKLVVRVSRP